ncbi:hypothetical protein SELMODRAFT_428489 [Selaginella moellendorffii]|uniref:Aminoglycoside phosphotransferase domain-containing protein n=1 Tax=Selaginella moellendorffii TaxID=88036 RepID=D8T308_SELML|nr:hypothetical protein SELMODRAFT_428489 [Selaginella moellendorffii]
MALCVEQKRSEKSATLSSSQYLWTSCTILQQRGQLSECCLPFDLLKDYLHVPICNKFSFGNWESDFAMPVTARCATGFGELKLLLLTAYCQGSKTIPSIGNTPEILLGMRIHAILDYWWRFQAAPAKLDKVVCQPLTHYVNLLPIHNLDPDMVIGAALVLRALKICLRLLYDYYRKVPQPTGLVRQLFLQRSIPYPLHAEKGRPKQTDHNPGNGKVARVKALLHRPILPYPRPRYPGTGDEEGHMEELVRVRVLGAGESFTFKGVTAAQLDRFFGKGLLFDEDGDVVTEQSDLPFGNYTYKLDFKFADSCISNNGPKDLENSKVLANLQESSEPKFLNCRPSHATPPIPLQLVHPVFGHFIDLTRDEQAPRLEDIEFVVELANLSSLYHSEDTTLRRAVHRLFSRYLDIPCRETLTISGNWEAHLAMMSRSKNKSLTAIGEVRLKNNLASYAHGFHCYALFWDMVGAKERYIDTCYPAFLMELVGCNLRISAMAKLDKVVCQPLTHFVNLLPIQGLDPDMVSDAVRVLVAFKRCLGLLDDYYWNAPAGTGERQLWNMDVPYPLHEAGKVVKQFGNKLVYLVEPLGVVKLAKRYGVEVHRAWAAAGFAPALYEVRALAGGWMEVKMEYLGRENGWEMLAECEDADEMRDQAVAALRSAHGVPVSSNGGVGVHGDARDVNVMVRRRDGGVEVRFIDFDWASIHGEGRYPPFMNVVEVQWPRGAECGLVMEQSHDVEFLSTPLEQQTALGLHTLLEVEGLGILVEQRA